MEISLDTPAKHSVVESSEFDVVLEKSSQANDEGIVISYDVASTEDYAVAVSFRDILPDVEPEAIGFHPDHAPHTWDTWGDEISIVHELPPTTTATFELGIVADAVDCSEEDPVLQSIECLDHSFNAREEGASVDDSAGSDHDNSMESGSFSDSEDNSPAKQDEREEIRPVPRESIPGDADELARDLPYPEKTATDNLIEVLLRKLGESDESGALAERLRDALASESSRSEQVRLRHVQTKMDDLSAYTATLESFIDEFDELPRWANATEDRLDTVEAKATEARNDTTGIDNDLTDLSERLEELETAFLGIEEAVKSASVPGDNAS